MRVRPSTKRPTSRQTAASPTVTLTMANVQKAAPSAGNRSKARGSYVYRLQCMPILSKLPGRASI